MKNKITPTENEIPLPDDKLLISKTNPKGEIKYVNTLFIQTSGYTESELLGKQHNIVRHPDMPRVIFKQMWETLLLGREFNGYIKNMAKNGDYYWVFANVTPSFSTERELLGFYSVRRKPQPQQLDFIISLYQELKEIENESTTKNAMENSQYKLNTILNARECGYDEFILTI